MRGQAQAFSSARSGSGRDDWCTPPGVLELVRQVGPIGLDPCGNRSSVVGARVEWFEDDMDGAHALSSWGASLRRARPGSLVFVNPPYSQMRRWVDKIANEAGDGTPIIALVAARPDTRWWRRLWAVADAVALWRGRIKFLVEGVPGTSAPFPSALFAHNLSQRRFRSAFAERAEVVLP